ncbi:Cytochrome P450 85A1 [Camellia lanceoleosa]|uniref:Cytochrome P450 85A1 n=1 Tax=Camellia lanceoleosa TaxID=1840588 RepID=A0ACC0G664_9ERIC|nr:Cytochrome P450 85A1 [Camellia lanceoleosa]
MSHSSAQLQTDDQTNICLEILDKGELQVAGKKRDSQLSSQFRDIATIVMQKTINPETQRPYTISMIERLMHEIHFAVDPHSSLKKQSLDVIREPQKHLPIKLSPMRLRLYVPEQKFSSLSEKLNDWTASIVSKDESGSQLSIVSMAFLSSLNQIASIEWESMSGEFMPEFFKLVLGTLSLPINFPGTNYHRGFQVNNLFLKQENIVSMLRRLVEERRACQETKHDMLGLLMNGGEENRYNLTDEEKIDQMIGILYSGYETVM